MLIRPDSNLEFSRISRSLIISSVTVLACFFLFVIGMGLKALQRKPVTGIESMIGETAEIFESLNPEGRVRIHGEIWKAISVSGKMDAGEKVRVTNIKDLTLYVEHMST